eukprot:CAMPEP_0181333614 /NCGR_PEP_ID=MMETSP1101-20121128/25776_1 /TAXON_ID=46948 /ORGANISM="Rhodomonas abbreviata, Strain Caron Lab Isolate" /LENGTH=553 /DNA_ID=CAMNT_0023443447 /DNA_START=487 /DNA_END=2148 /DNA_ORIENTATION=-
MFCAQCSQHNQDCTISVGNCKKTPQVANLQDEMMKLAKEIGYYAHAVRGMGKTVPNHIDRGTLICIFATLTNVNNDATRFTKYKRHGRACVEELKYLCGPRVTAPVLPDASILAQREAAPDANASSLCEMLAYGIKGVAAYADHAAVFGKEDQKIYAFIHEALSFLTSPERHDPSKALEMCLRCGEANLWTMDLLYQANTTLGIPEPTEVQVKPEDGKCILVSGHDLKVVSSLLEACEKEDIKVYTHGELLPANSYPKLKKFKCLVGHYGGAWNRQHHEFSHFPGPIVMTSNCLTEPQNTYKNQVFTFGPVGWPGVKHLGKDSNKIDWSSVIKLAQQLDGFSVQDFTFSYDPVSGYGQPSPTEPQMVGFGHEAVLGAAETVLAGVKGGAISRFFLIGGCDGDAAQRNYFTNLAEKLPDTSVVLTLGCAKFRVSDAARARLGQIGDTGIPRVLDVGQCNDSYSAVRIAMGLADALECKISDLPLSIVLSWHEQKAIAVLLTCLHLGLKPIRLGPTLPAFLTEDVLQVLVKEFGIKVCNDVDADLKEMMDAKAAS